MRHRSVTKGLDRAFPRRRRLLTGEEERGLRSNAGPLSFLPLAGAVPPAELLRRFLDHRCDLRGLRDVDDMAGVDLDRLRAGALVHEALEVGIDRTILGRDDP